MPEEKLARGVNIPEEELANGIKTVQLEIITEVDRVCRKNGLKYYLAYGTLIGAMRHDGFIPWDDDIDIMMPYDDMLKFQNIATAEMDGKRFFYQSPETEQEYRLSINRVRRYNTTMLEESMAGKAVHSGIFVDIYPLFGAAPQGIKRKIQIIRAMLRALYLLNEPVKNHGVMMKIGSTILLKLKTKNGKEKAQRKLLRKISKYDYDTVKCLTVLDSGTKEMSTDYERDWFGAGVPHKYEDIELLTPDNSDAVLRKYFGDYMILPPEKERCYHHNFLDIKINGGNEKK